MTVCQQCGYDRTKNDSDSASKDECPRCRTPYNKWIPFTVSKNIEYDSTNNKGPNVTARKEATQQQAIFIIVSFLCLVYSIMYIIPSVFVIIFEVFSQSGAPDWLVRFNREVFNLLPLAALFGLTFGLLAISINRNSEWKVITILGGCLSLFIFFKVLSMETNQPLSMASRSPVWLFSLELLPFGVLGGVIFGIAEIVRKKDKGILKKDAAIRRATILICLIPISLIPISLIILLLRILLASLR